MCHRSRDNLVKNFPNIPITSNIQPSVFFGGCELEDPLGEQLKIFEEPIGEEEEIIPRTYTINKNRNGIEDKEGTKSRGEVAFPIKEANGDARMKKISPSTIPHFHGLTLEDLDTFLFEFVVICRTYDYTSDDQKLKFFPSSLKDASLCWFVGLPGDNITT